MKNWEICLCWEPNPDLKGLKSSNITTTPSNLVTSHRKQLLYKCLKNTQILRVFYISPGVKNTRVEMRVTVDQCRRQSKRSEGAQAESGERGGTKVDWTLAYKS